MLRKLQSKANQALESYYKLKLSPNSDHAFLRTPQEENEDELAIFGGRTRLVGPKSSSAKPSPSPSSTAMGSFSSSSSRPEIVIRPEHRVPSQNSAAYTPTPQPMSEVMSDWNSPTSATSQRHFFPSQSHDTSPYSQPPSIPSRLDTATPSYSSLSHGHSHGVHMRDREKLMWQQSPVSGAASGPPQINPSARSLPPPRPSMYRSSQPSLHSMHEEFRAFPLHYPQGHPPPPPHQQSHSPTHSHPHPQHSPSPTHSQSLPLPHQQPHQQYGGYYTPPTPAPSHSTHTAQSSPVFNQPAHYTPAPREFAEMGLASQGSGLNQQWTSFMTESGVFYENQL